MKACVALVLLGLAVVAHGKIDLGNLVYGTCVEMCSSNPFIRALGFGGCPDGYVCRSNGCGHTCQKAVVTKKDLRQLFGICVEMCFPGGCPDGMECRSNGCGHTCQGTKKKRLLTDLCNQLPCAIYCPFGMKTDPTGCSSCQCNDWFNIPL